MIACVSEPDSVPMGYLVSASAMFQSISFQLLGWGGEASRPGNERRLARRPGNLPRAPSVCTYSLSKPVPVQTV